MSVINTQPLAGASGNQGVAGYNLTKSLRFRASASASLSRTPASAGNRQKWTWSGWVKRGLFNDQQVLFAGFVDTGNYTLINTYQDSFIFQCASASNIDTYQVSTMVLRDPAAWYHIVYAIDTTQATAANRAKMYVNGVQITSFSTNTQPPLNYNTFVNATNTHFFSKFNNNLYFDGYMAEVNFVDGQQLTPSDFGETDTITGVWKPKAFTGTYGTNGFYLPFTDVATTSGSNAGLGKDFSGNGNYWTTNNISVTSGSTYDSMTDVPTLTDASTANYCVMNPLDTYNSVVPSSGNLSLVGTGVGGTGSIYAKSGKFYFEVSYPTIGSQYPVIGIRAPAYAQYCTYWGDGRKNVNGTLTSYGATYTTNDIIGVAFDIDSNTVTFYKNNTSQGAISYAFNGLEFTCFIGTGSTQGSDVCNINFGQRPFAYTPPSGYVALNTYNLPDSTIVAGNTVMDATTWTGTGSSTSITNAGGFKPDLLWGKMRNSADKHYIFNSNAGVTKFLSSNLTDAETTDSTIVTSLNSNGFTLGSSNDLNRAGGYNYVGWQWQAGQGTTSSNTAGSITSTVSVNASAGFSVVTYPTSGSTNTIGHGLGVTPSLIITKVRDDGTNWPVYHQSLGATKALNLNLTNAATLSSVFWNDTAPTSSVFTVSGSLFNPAKNAVAYCWSEVAGFSKFGSYTGNGSADGPFVYTGFRPKFVLIKSSSIAGSYWVMQDTTRNTYNVMNSVLYPNGNDAEATTTNIDSLSNGFKLRTTSSDYNQSGSTYIYMAFAENPFKNSLAR